MAHRPGLIFAVFAVAILIVAAVFVAAFYQSQTQSSTGTQYLNECSEAWPPQSPGPNTTQLETLAAMTVKLGTTAKICVEYNSGSSSDVTSPLNGSVYFENNMSSVPTSIVHVSALPVILKAPAMRGNSPSPVAYAVFTLNVSSSAQGFYMLSLEGICPQMQLAIGYSQINYSDFAYGWQHRYQCASEDFFGSYVSVSNIGVSYSYVPLSAN